MWNRWALALARLQAEPPSRGLRALWLLALLLLALCYAPFFDDAIPLDALPRLWVRVMNPFDALPFIVGVLSLWVTARSGSFLWRLPYAAIFIACVLLSYVRVMGLTSYWELFYFVPLILMAILHPLIWIASFEGRSL